MVVAILEDDIQVTKDFSVSIAHEHGAFVPHILTKIILVDAYFSCRSVDRRVLCSKLATDLSESIVVWFDLIYAVERKFRVTALVKSPGEESNGVLFLCELVDAIAKFCQRAGGQLSSDQNLWHSPPGISSR